MDRELDEEIKISLLKRLTGRQDPSLKRIIASVIVAVLIFLSTFFAGFYLNKAMIEPSANVVFHPYNIVDNSSLPIMITNGPKPLTDVKLKVKTCHMKNFEIFPIPDLIENQEFPVNLKDEDTVYALGKILKDKDFCNPLNTSPNVQCFIKTYIVKGQIYTPPQECKIFRCGDCEYELNLESKEFSKNFSDSFFSPIEIKTFSLNVVPNNPIDVSDEDMVPLTPIGISIFGPYDRCMFRTDNL